MHFYLTVLPGVVFLLFLSLDFKLHYFVFGWAASAADASLLPVILNGIFQMSFILDLHRHFQSLYFAALSHLPPPHSYQFPLPLYPLLLVPCLNFSILVTVIPLQSSPAHLLLSAPIPTSPFPSPSLSSSTNPGLSFTFVLPPHLH